MSGKYILDDFMISVRLSFKPFNITNQEKQVNFIVNCEKNKKCSEAALDIKHLSADMQKP